MKNILRATHLIYIEYLAFELFVTLVNYWTIDPNGYMTIDVPMCLKTRQMSFILIITLTLGLPSLLLMSVHFPRARKYLQPLSLHSRSPFRLALRRRRQSLNLLSADTIAILLLLLLIRWEDLCFALQFPLCVTLVILLVKYLICNEELDLQRDIEL